MPSPNPSALGGRGCTALGTLGSAALIPGGPGCALTLTLTLTLTLY